ncbi:MAG: hypothetical protein AB7R40_22435 [Nitrospiraceae bacterium]
MAWGRSKNNDSNSNNNYDHLDKLLADMDEATRERLRNNEGLGQRGNNSGAWIDEDLDFDELMRRVNDIERSLRG